MKRWTWSGLLGLGLVLLVLGSVCALGSGAKRLERHVVAMSAPAVTNAPTGSYTHTGGGYVRVVEIASLWTPPDTTNTAHLLKVDLELAAGVTRAVSTNTIISPPTNRTVSVGENLYMWTGQRLDFSAGSASNVVPWMLGTTNVADHAIFLILER